MDEKKLLAFIQKIIANTKGNKTKTEKVLLELKLILEAQGVNSKLTSIVQNSIDAVPEIYDLAKEQHITIGQISKAYNQAESRRAEERRRREEAYRNQGRC